MIINYKGLDILYGEEIISLKKLGKNFNISSIENINDDNLFECIDTIIAFNPYSEIERVQYNINENKLYFYTNEPINIKKWYQCNNLTYVSPDSQSGLVKKIINILESQDRIDTTCISAYDLMNILKDYDKRYNEELFKILKELDDTIHIKIHNGAEISIKDMAFYERTMEVNFKKYPKSESKTIKLIKDKDGLKIKESDSPYAQDLLEACRRILTKYYDFMLATKDYRSEVSWSEDILNGELYLGVYKDSIDIHDRPHMPHMRLQSHVDKDDYEIVSDFNTVENVLKGFEEKLFKQAYVNIDLCPTWIRKDAIDLRMKQVKEEIKRLNKEQKIKNKTRSK